MFKIFLSVSVFDFFSKKEQTEHPNAVLDALKLYDHSVKRQNTNKFMGTNSMEDLVEGIGGTKNSLLVSLPNSKPITEKEKLTLFK